jgi:hypothetical protein
MPRATKKSSAIFGRLFCDVLITCLPSVLEVD